MGMSAYGWGYDVDTPVITRGPNLGLYFVTSLTDQSVYGWELNPGLTNSSDPFYQAQSKACWAGVTVIIAAVQNHETGQPSHYSEVNGSLGKQQSRPPFRGFHWRQCCLYQESNSNRRDLSGGRQRRCPGTTRGVSASGEN